MSDWWKFALIYGTVLGLTMFAAALIVSIGR